MMMSASTRTRLASALVVLAFTFTWATADTLRVDPNDPTAFKTIQDAIDAAWDFDTIVVTPGVYHEHINFFGKAISAASTDPNDPNVVGATVLDGDGAGNVVTFNNAETPFSVLDGFTITNGQVGVYCQGGHTRPVIKRCVIRANTAGIDGPYANPPVVEAHASPTVVASIVQANSTIGIRNCGGKVEDCLIANNGEHGIHNCWGQVVRSTIRQNAGHGAYNQRRAPGSLVNCIVSGNKKCGVACDEVYTSWLVRNCTIVGNGNDGIFMGDGTSGTVVNSVIVQNLGWGLSGYRATAASRYNDVYGNTLGSYWFVEAGSQDIHEKPWFAG
ncbi:MAG: right-handed parallel beta-helix repeat-containing protein, partial [Sedimentisphaerales bacterium]|nr:right-handed parallel beta-helix repeat-containing protein [Sedimentisphaerales bacterium]